MFLSTILFPLFSFFICSLFGRYIGKVGSSLVSVCFMGIATILSMTIFYFVTIQNNVYFVDLGM
jgi:NADH:ubiquinone oxidoreductase subunit 5 (subunit L)/multisubunit Na+/H+ antiporter MnhA subunit